MRKTRPLCILEAPTRTGASRTAIQLACLTAAALALSSCSTARTTRQTRDNGTHVITSTAHTESEALEAAWSEAREICQPLDRRPVEIARYSRGQELSRNTEQAIGVAATLVTGGRMHGFNGNEDDEQTISLEVRCE